MHSDNGFFVSDQFRLDCDKKYQEKYLCWVGAQHHNARTERAITTIIYVAITFMVRSYLYWRYHGVDDISIWSLAINFAVLFHNLLQNYHYSITPLDLITIHIAGHRYLSRSHVWGCPIFVLDTIQKSYQKIPKWNCSSLLGQFLGFS